MTRPRRRAVRAGLRGRALHHLRRSGPPPAHRRSRRTPVSRAAATRPRPASPTPPSTSSSSARSPRAISCSSTRVSRSSVLERRGRMKYVDEFRDAELGRVVSAEIASTVDAGRHYKVMEVCGGHTHSIYKYGVDDLLPPNVELVHGPGCPVCVIPMGRVDDGIAVARNPEVIFTCFGDMLRVPGARRHAARRQGRGRRRAHGLLAARRAAHRAREPRSRRRLLRHRLRDDGAVDGAHAAAREGRGDRELPLPLQPRHDRAAAAGAAGVARPPARRLHRAGPRGDGRGGPAVRVHPGRLRASRS